MDLPWWNPAAQSLESASLPEPTFGSAPNPDLVVTRVPAKRRERSWLWLTFGVAVIATLIPRGKRTDEGSDTACFRHSERACRSGDAKATWQALHAWFARMGLETQDDPQLAALDAHRLGSGGDWSPEDLRKAMQNPRRDPRLRKPRRDSGLAPLNP